MEGGGDLVSVAEAAQRLGRSTEQVRRYLREGRLGGRRFGGQWFIEVAALEAFRPARRGAAAFLERVAPGDEQDPLADAIGIGGGGGSNLADGKESYRRAYRWRR